MKRDMDLVRLILLEMEKQPAVIAYSDLIIDDYSQDEITYHIILLDEAGLIIAKDQSTMGRINWIPQRLTWEGHEFLEASRDDNNWTKAKDIMAKSGGFIFDIAKEVLIQIIKNKVMSSTGTQ